MAKDGMQRYERKNGRGKSLDIYIYFFIIGTIRFLGSSGTLLLHIKTYELCCQSFWQTDRKQTHEWRKYYMVHMSTPKNDERKMCRFMVQIDWNLSINIGFVCVGL